MGNAMEDSAMVIETPQHGHRGNRRESNLPHGPLGPTIAISRESGARGATIARRVGRKLGWDVYTREHLEFLAANDTQRDAILCEAPSQAKTWLEKQANRLERDGVSLFDDKPDPIFELILALAANGNLIFVGRGAGYLLPRKTTLHVRIVAPLESRIGYMAEHLRLGKAEAELQVRRRDEARFDFLTSHCNRRAGELCDYDMVLNSAELGEDLVAEIIVQALKAKQKRFAESC